MKSRTSIPALMLALVTLLGTAALATAADPDANTAASSRPNVIFILADDLDRQTFNPQTMPRTFSYVRNRGTVFPNYIIPMPTCCPSRAASLSGQYNHNNGVLENGPMYGSYRGYYRHRRSQGIGFGYNLGTFMQNGGYRTALIGKYMNGYGAGYIRGRPGTGPPDIPGWDRWFVPIQNRSQKYYNYKVRFNQKPKNFRPAVFGGDPTRMTGDVAVDAANRVAFYSAPICGVRGGCSRDIRRRQHRNFSERIFVNQAIDFLATGSRGTAGGSRPAFIWYAADTPHGTSDNTLFAHRRTWGGPEYSPRERRRFRHLGLLRHGAFNEFDVSDKPGYIRKAPSFDGSMLQRIRRHNRARWRAAFSLDRELGRLYDYLDQSGLSRKTVIVFTSDNGYMSGQHRLPHGKQVPYRESTEFPFIIKGPGIAAGRTVGQLAANFDLAPTVLGLAKLPQSVVRDPRSGLRQPFDGVDLAPYAAAGKPARTDRTRRAVMLESVANRGLHKVERFRHYKGVRTARYSYIRYYRPTYSALFDCPAGLLSSCTKGLPELYDLLRDPDQRNNLVAWIRRSQGDPAWRARNQQLLTAYAGLQHDLDELQYCAGNDCLK